ncbi:hypothetical protein COO60DRAFT_762122 [Scenedesmus sp. NREL 46B-D3]|nr:hypothetical protein COO60DRAFT_762122 [Scenedesmus sp. NREL 46B-D3]
MCCGRCCWPRRAQLLPRSGTMHYPWQLAWLLCAVCCVGKATFCCGSRRTQCVAAPAVCNWCTVLQPTRQLHSSRLLPAAVAAPAAPMHLVGAIARIPCGWFWFGGVVSRLAAVAVDVADPSVACESTVCVLTALQAQAAANPWQLLFDIMCIALRSSPVFAVDVVLPGLLLTWLELRARQHGGSSSRPGSSSCCCSSGARQRSTNSSSRHLLQQLLHSHQRQGRPTAAAATANPAAAH